LFVEILRDILATIVVSFLGWLYQQSARSFRPSRPVKRGQQITRRKRNLIFYVSLLIFTVSVHGIFSTSWASAFSVPGVVKSLCFVLAVCSFVLLQGAFEAQPLDDPDRSLPDGPSNRKADNRRNK